MASSAVPRATHSSVERGLKALHETRRTKAWAARRCSGAVKSALEQRLLCIERSLLAAIAADSGRALHYDSLHAAQPGCWDRWASSRSLTSEAPTHLRTWPAELEPEPEPEPGSRSVVDQHVDAIVLGAAAAAWALKVGRVSQAASPWSNSTGAREHALTLKVGQLESQLAAMHEDSATKQVAWE
eukprot:COSAG02_NODE_19431_length_882_cov_1.243934_1_plen_184_part_10